MIIIERDELLKTQREKLNQPLTSADFFRIDEKTIDFRYQLYKALSESGKNESGTIRYIGSLRTSPTDTNSRNCIEFIDHEGKMQFDSFFIRGEDQVSTGQRKRVMYDLGKIKIELKKYSSYKFLNILLEETVDYGGVQTVSAIYNPSHSGENKFGFPTQKAWINIPFIELQKEVQKILSGTTHKLEILSNEDYPRKEN